MKVVFAKEEVSAILRVLEKGENVKNFNTDTGMYIDFRNNSLDDYESYVLTLNHDRGDCVDRCDSRIEITGTMKDIYDWLNTICFGTTSHVNLRLSNNVTVTHDSNVTEFQRIKEEGN